MHDITTNQYQNLVLHIIGFAFSCFLVFLLLLKKNRFASDRILTMWMVVIAVHMLAYLGISSGFCFRYPHLLGLSFPLPLLHGVFLYFYTRSITGMGQGSTVGVLKHLLPAFVITVLAIPFYALPADQKLAVFQNEGEGFEWFTVILVLVIVVSGLSYSIAAILLIKKHRKNLLTLFSNTDRKMLRWLEILSIGFAVIWFAVIFFDDPVIFGIVSLFVFFIALIGINQVPVFYSYSSEPAILEGDRSLGEKPREQAANRDKTKEDAYLKGVLEKLEKLMESEKPYRDTDLTLVQLAAQLHLSPNTVSQTINSVAGKSFYQYINDFRIKEFIETARLPENQKFTLIALAYESGFKSKTTFNKYFKDTTGKTPTEFFAFPKSKD